MGRMKVKGDCVCQGSLHSRLIQSDGLEKGGLSEEDQRPFMTYILEPSPKKTGAPLASRVSTTKDGRQAHKYAECDVAQGTTRCSTDWYPYLPMHRRISRKSSPPTWSITPKAPYFVRQDSLVMICCIRH